MANLPSASSPYCSGPDGADGAGSAAAGGRPALAGPAEIVGPEGLARTTASGAATTVPDAAGIGRAPVPISTPETGAAAGGGVPVGVVPEIAPAGGALGEATGGAAAGAMGGAAGDEPSGGPAEIVGTGALSRTGATSTGAGAAAGAGGDASAAAWTEGAAGARNGARRISFGIRSVVCAASFPLPSLFLLRSVATAFAPVVNHSATFSRLSPRVRWTQPSAPPLSVG